MPPLRSLDVRYCLPVLEKLERFVTSGVENEKIQI